jgi:predicted enzyme related to lactoylglutathione lyase
MKSTILLSLFLLAISPASGQDQPEREKVLGIGGLFFRAENPGRLANWYDEHLGVSLVPSNYEEQPWQQQAGSTVFAPFDQGTEYFGEGGKMWMVNFRVSDLDAMVAQLREAGITVDVDPQEYPNGRFARLYDPEGNPIELWEPK